MLRILSAVLVVVMLVLIAYRQMGSKPTDVRVSIEAGIKEARMQHNLSSEETAILRLQLAVLNYTAKKGHPPDSLDELVPTYFDKVPVDPKTKKEWEYERKGEDYTLGGLPQPEQVEVASAMGQEGQQEEYVPISSGDFVNPNTLKEDDYVYDARDKRDPFRPFSLTPDRPDGGELTPLELYTLAQLRVTAIISDSAGDGTAIIEDAAGKGYPVRVGTKVGNSGGVIISIAPDHVQILETKTDLYGKENQNIHEMEIHKRSTKKK